MKIKKILDRDIRQKNIDAFWLALKSRYYRLTGATLKAPIFIVGCSRSGTTVTYETISSAPSLHSIGYELPQMWNSLFGPHTNNWHSEAASEKDACEAHRKLASSYFLARFGSGVVLDKTCINVLRIPYLLKLFPDARIVYIHRDGPDNISSLIDGWRDGRFNLRQFLGDSPEKVEINGGEFESWHFFLPAGWRDYNKKNLEEVCAYQWVTANSMALEAKRNVPAEQWISLRYEDIFVDPINMYKRAFERLDLRFSDAVEERCASLSKKPTSIVSGAPEQEKWRSRNPEMVGRVLELIHPLRHQLGYV